ncbi:MAG: proton-conducting transporter membrane subunit [Chloroflexota bacterium]
MNAPFLWILLPLLMAGLALLARTQRTAMIIGAATAAILAFIALVVPINVAFAVGPFSFKLGGTLNFLGRSFTFATGDGPLLAVLYGLAAIWFFGSESVNMARRLTPAGLAILALLVGSMAVQPFLFAALLIEVACLLAAPMLLPLNQPPGRGILRFVIYQTLAMPFILFAGWLLAGVETSPGDAALTGSASAILFLGFAFLLAIFPLNTWIPMLLEETPAYVTGFLLWILSQTAILFAMSFVDRYTFLRLSPDLPPALRVAGLTMVGTAGLWAAFERHLGRLMGFAVIAETGYTLLSLSLGSSAGIETIFLQMIPRGFGMAVWAMSLTIIQGQVEEPRFSNVQGAARAVPFATVGLILASLSSVGVPLLAGFPARLALMEELASVSLGQVLALMIGLGGLLTGTIRTLAVSVMTPANTPWERRESRAQMVLLVLGVAVLFVLGLFPQATRPLLENLPALFPRLGL